MKTTQRNYSDTSGDFNRISRFIIEHNAQIRTCSTWCLGRFVDWRYGLFEHKLPITRFCSRNAHLWFDGFGDLAGFAIAENGDNGVAIITAPGYTFLFEAILQWAIEHWNDRGPGLSIEITGRQTRETAILEHFGFQLRSTFYTRRFDLTQELPPRQPLEPGFTIVDMFSHPDYRAQRIMRDEAFSGRSGLSEDELCRELELQSYSHKGPIYHPQCDLCVMAEDGSFVAGCEALIDAHNTEADIERVCTHSSFRRRGFARAVIQECLDRLRAMGIRSVYITGYSDAAIALYGSLGAVAETCSFIYESSNVVN